MTTLFSSPVVSVVIPAYNAEKTILETIESVRKQSLSNFEIIVINDGSTDSTIDLVKSIDDSRIKVFSYENGGLSIARNRGISLAQGEFIAFLDADDLWTSDKLELQVQALHENSDAGVAYSWTYFMDEVGQSFHKGESIFFEGNVLADLLVWNFIASGSNPLIRAQAVLSTGEFDPSVAGAADWDYWLRLAADWSYVVVPKPQVFYRLSSGSMSSKVEYMESCQLDVLDRAFQSVPLKLKRLRNQSLSYVYRYSAKLYLTRSSEVKGLNNASGKLSKAIWLYPKTLFSKETQKLLFKVFLTRLISPKIASLLLQRISQARATRVRASN
ncbi:MAG: glycosyltransferase [Oscillatoriophycideae cyanobacterium NC_groundwater_1537_Pr4_S-0.65um_50_18]|nr:glycosyltransferase [Oscillatoriophycideae cyanobacterium NC_groundwater_1537_Pr4_S-0.65um_50_18]